MKEHGSWTGETHVQKMAYSLRELMEVPFTFDFILYERGPFSFELRDELSMMHTDRLVERETQSRHGSRIAVTARSLEGRAPLPANGGTLQRDAWSGSHSGWAIEGWRMSRA